MNESVKIENEEGEESSFLSVKKVLGPFYHCNNLVFDAPKRQSLTSFNDLKPDNIGFDREGVLKVVFDF
jgi:hypothetical protein